MGINERIEYLEMKERHKKKLRPWYKKPWGIFTIVLLLGLMAAIVASAFYVAGKVQEIRSGQSADQQKAEIQKITAAIDGKGENYSLGPIDAKVKIVIFSDYACPYCKQAAPVVRNLAKKYGNQIRITFRDYPLHDNSVDLALAGNCAGAQNKFWEMHDLLFDKQETLSSLKGSELNLKLKELAAGIGIDSKIFADCLDNKTYLYRLNDDFADAELLGLSGTPSWFVNRYKITGFYPEENFTNIIDGLLAK